MTLYDAAWAIREAMKVCQAAEDMIAAGAIGDVLRETVQHGVELLDIADEEMGNLTGMRYHVMAAASPMLAQSSGFCATSSTRWSPLEMYRFRYRDPLTGK